MQRILFISLPLLILFYMGCKDDNPAEPGNPSSDFLVTIENVAGSFTYTGSGVFNTPVGAGAPAAIGPGESYEFTFDATPGSRLSFATMFVQSNDFFYAPAVNGIELFNGSDQVTGDVTSQIKLWDAGTEVNQEPGLGVDQAPRQGGANTGDVDPDNTVREAPDTFNNLPVVSDVIKVTLSTQSTTGFKVTIENVSTSTTLSSSDDGMHAVPLAPGVFVIHSGDNPLFTPGTPDAGNGLEGIAEDGNPSDLDDYVSMMAGITQIIAPGVWAVHTGDDILFMSGQADYGEGLEALAEDGDPSVISSSVSSKSGVRLSGVFNTPVGSAGPGPVVPGSSYQFSFTANAGEKLSLSTMFVQSNDLFYSPDGMGINLFDSSNNPVTGDVTSMFQLWDAGTEKNEKPGFGANQAPRQSGANTGEDENGNVINVNDGFSYPSVSDVIKVTIEMQ